MRHDTLAKLLLALAAVVAMAGAEDARAQAQPCQWLRTEALPMYEDLQHRYIRYRTIWNCGGMEVVVEDTKAVNQTTGETDRWTRGEHNTETDERQTDHGAGGGPSPLAPPYLVKVIPLREETVG
ncbi:MAG TPA: hypothetical protein VEO54_00720 [Thermoanaerobaculia bacterium]|nr:hypothetical protein [Thermoanaerobaculia bacterium]